MSSALIEEYVSGLHRQLPAAIAEEAADGLIETYEHHLAAWTGEQSAARAAVAEFGDLEMVVGEFIRQAPGRRAARILLAAGPAVGAAWAAALILSQAWTWSVPAAARISFGAALLLAVLALAIAATSRRSYPRTRLTTAASPVILALDASAVSAVLLAAPSLTWVLAIAVAASMTRIALIAWSLPRTSWADLPARRAGACKSR